MSDRPDFRRRQGPPPRGVGPLLAALLVALVLAAAVSFLPREAPGSLVEVTGDVPSPGTYLVSPATVAAAIAAAGGEPLPDDRVVPPGHRVRVDEGSATLLPPSDPLLVGLPLDVNAAEVHELMAIPGLGPRTAGAIVAHREVHGPFPRLDALVDVAGVGPSTLERLRPFLTVPDPRPVVPAGPVDVNRADAQALASLPGIGPVTAARIVVERAEGGPFTSLNDLQRVHGIGPALAAGLEGLAVAVPPEGR